MFDHIGYPVSDIAKAKAFYVKALEPLGVTLLMEITAEQTGADAHLGFGADGKAFFWLGDGKGVTGGLHVAFPAETRAQVHAFYEAAMAAGGTDNGGPGPRPDYSPTYYAAFVRDPDGNNIEACTRVEA